MANYEQDSDFAGKKSLKEGYFKMNVPILSIVVPTYGHEKYISQALDSILMQKTNYSYEVLIGEDASPDNTKHILREYEKRYPGVFTVFYREINMMSIGESNGEDLLRRARGKYIIILEGDDYWIDALKIEKQISFLEHHIDYIAVAHNCLVVDENSNRKNEIYPECKEIEYTIRHYRCGILPGQLTTVMFRNCFLDKKIDTSILEKRLSPGDRLLYFLLITHGKIYCIQETMTAYRHVISGGLSYSANYKFDYSQEKNWHYELLKYADSLSNRNALMCAEMLYVQLHFRSLKNKNISFKTFFVNVMKVKHKFTSLCLYVSYKINKFIRKK